MNIVPLLPYTQMAKNTLREAGKTEERRNSSCSPLLLLPSRAGPEKQDQTT